MNLIAGYTPAEEKEKSCLEAVTGSGLEGISQVLGLFYGRWKGSYGMWRQVNCKLWFDPKIKNLSPQNKLLFIYLLTNNSTHLSGIYNLPFPSISYETGLTGREIKSGLKALAENKLIKFDSDLDVCWVINMLKYQGRGVKILTAVASQLKELNNSFLIKDFLSYYDTLSIPYRYPIDTLSIGYPTGEGEGIGEEKDQEKNTSTVPKGSGTARLVPAELSDLELYREDPKLCGRWAKMYPEWIKTYPAVDIMKKITELHTWELANPKKQKKQRVRWFTNRLAEEQDKGPRKPRGGPSGKAPWETAQEESENAMRKQLEERNERKRKNKTGSTDSSV